AAGLGRGVDLVSLYRDDVVGTRRDRSVEGSYPDSCAVCDEAYRCLHARLDEDDRCSIQDLLLVAYGIAPSPARRVGCWHEGSSKLLNGMLFRIVSEHRSV